jgi:hypothetical protein
MRGFLRKAWQENRAEQALRRISYVPERSAASLEFSEIWEELCRRHPSLKRARPLKPSELPSQIAMAHLILHHLRGLIAARADRPHRAKSSEPEVVS